MQVYYIPDINQISPTEIDKFYNILPPERKKRADSFRFKSGKASCILSYALFLKGYRKLGYDDTPEFDIGINGKPYIKARPDVHFNISHSHNSVVCIFSDSPVGIDIEHCRRITNTLISKVCSEEDIIHIKNSPCPEMEFCKLWTVKEAVAKLKGESVFDNIRDLNAAMAFVVSIQIADNTYMSIAADKPHHFDIHTIKKEV